MYFSEETKEKVNRINPMRILEYYSIPFRIVGKYLSLPCPIHNAKKDENFKVNMETYRWACFSHNCVKNATNIGFVMKYKDIDFVAAVNILAAIGNIQLEGVSGTKAQLNRIKNKLNNKKTVPKQIETSQVKKTYTLYIPHNDGIDHPAIQEKKISEETIKKFCIYYNNRMNRIIFLVKNEEGKPVCYKGRAITEEQLKVRKFTSTKDYVVDTLYGLWVTAPYIKEKHEMYLVEGHWDVVRLFENGVHNIAGTMGNNIVEAQAKWIKDNRIAIVNIVPDKDFDLVKNTKPPGENLILKAYEYLGDDCIINIIDYPGYAIMLKDKTILYSVAESRIYKKEYENVFSIDLQKNYMDKDTTEQWRVLINIDNNKNIDIISAVDKDNNDISSNIVKIKKYKDPDNLPTALIKQIFKIN